MTNYKKVKSQLEANGIKATSYLQSKIRRFLRAGYSVDQTVEQIIQDEKKMDEAYRTQPQISYRIG